MSRPIVCVSPELTLSEDVAIVGSGGIANKQLIGYNGVLRNISRGDRIDNHTDIIRFNRAPTKGYENIVGSRTTLRVTNNHVFNNNDIANEGYTDQPKDFIRELKDSRILYIAEDVGPWNNRDSNADPSADLYLYDWWGTYSSLRQAASLPSDKNLSVGMVMMYLCIASGITPTLYGFGIEASDPRDHYWEDRPPASGVHDIGKEKNILKDLASKKKIRISALC
tara:strand:- start:5378 stop:6049 length:672 start_codon:yes stop_codon:yes gene_type:complete